MCGDVEVERHAFCVPVVTKPTGKAPVTCWMGFLVGPGASLDAVDNTKLSLRLPGIELLILSSSSFSGGVVESGC